jgi:hypothetical protein
MRINPIGMFKVIEKDNDTYELEDIGMKRLDLTSATLWVRCKRELVEGMSYKGKLSFHPSESLQRGKLPEFYPE